MMGAISANDLKVKGVSAIEKNVCKEQPEVMITVRGQAKYVVMPLESYNRYREMELQVALDGVKREVESGHYIVESVNAHIQRVSK